MEKKFKIRNLLFLIVALVGLQSLAYAQGCQIKSDRPDACRNDLVTFEIPSSTSFSTIKWEFGDGETSTLPIPTVAHSYDTFGVFTVKVTLYDAGGGVKCSSTMDMTIYDNPTAYFDLPDSSIQCFETNKFLFKDGSKPGKYTGAPIRTRVWDLGDGNVSKDKAKFTHSYKSSGKYTIILTVTDTNGCSDSTVRSSEIVVLPKLAPRFVTSFGTGCPETIVKFKNNTDTSGKNIIKWTWDFDDGTRVSDDPFNADDTIWTKFEHTYHKDGRFDPTLIIESSFGCIDSFTNFSGAQNIFYWFDIKKSEPGPVCWDGNNVCFAHKPRPNAYYWLWEFDDPPSMLLNFNDEDWEPCHHYTAPGFYNIKLTIYEPNCIRDTTFCAYIPLKGPMAVINLASPPFPANNHLQGKPIPLDYFHAAASTCLDVDGDGSPNDVVNYVTRSYGTPYMIQNKFRGAGTNLDILWCNGLLDSVNFDTTFKDPYPCVTRKLPPITGISYPFFNSGNPVIMWDSVYETPGTWTKGNPLPNGFTSGKIYFPTSGSANFHTMHDTDLYKHDCSGPNYVRFTNNSIKYRLYYAIDNDPSAYVFPGNDLRFDTCQNPSYPWASDSMEYLWDFSDGDPCTSTEANPDINCRFSEEIQPWHLYKEDGCYPASLTVTDKYTNCQSKTTVNIVMEAPDAGWDTTKFAFMDYLTQRSTPPGIGRRGVMLNGIPCVGNNYPQVPDFSETLPSCDRQFWWMVFDSTALGFGGCQTLGDPDGDGKIDTITNMCKDVTYIDTDNDGVKESMQTHIRYDCGWVDMITFMLMGNQWIYGDGGWKSIGLILKTGDCFDTFFYHNYKYIFDVNASFNIQDPDKYDPVTGEYPNMIYAENQHLRLCPPHQAILTAADTLQLGITKFKIQISPYFSPPWVDPVYLEDSFKLTREDTIYMICHKDSFSIDPFTGEKVYTNCFMYPNIVANEKFDYSVYNSLHALGWFAKDTLPQLKLTDTLFHHDENTTKPDRIQPEHSMTMPGKYYITGIARNVYGCFNMARARVFVGHYTYFDANDRIICYEGGGDTITFTHFVRYFRVKLTPMEPDLNPIAFWEDPLTPRGGTPPSTGILEKIDFDLDGDSIFETPGITGYDTVVGIYNKPGDYTVRMRTLDSNGCYQVLEREAYIKVIGVVADFVDTNTTKPYICGQLVGFLDKSYGLNTWKYIYNKQGTVIDSFEVDSVVKWWWDFGDNQGTRSIAKIKNPVHTYTTGTYDVNLIVKNTNGCVDTIKKEFYIDVLGPQPKFWIVKNDTQLVTTDTICAGDYVFLKDTSQYMSKWLFYKDYNKDEVSFLAKPNNGIFPIKYDSAGIYNIVMKANERVADPAHPGDTVACSMTYGDTVANPFDPVFTVVVMANKKYRLSGDTLICDSTVASFFDESDTGFASALWNFGDDPSADWLPAVPKTKVQHMYTTGTSSYDTVYTVKLSGTGYQCVDKVYRSMQIQVVKTDADISYVDSSELPIMKFYNGSKGATNYRWTIEGIDQSTENTSYYQEFEVTDTTSLTNDFGNIKGDFKVCLYTWINNDGLDPATNGCIKKECVVVNNHYRVKIEIPNIFTPGVQDGKNDKFTIKNEGVEIWDLTIYNRWGEKVFHSEDPEEHWNGLNKQDGSECAAGTYYYVIKYQLRGRELDDATGTVTLIR